ncbi:MAG: metabolite traffic protein EboE [Verrucomicrobiota bacterium]
MKLNHDAHLAYCTNIHRGESWDETLAALEQYTLQVRRRVAEPDEVYAVGLRLGAAAAHSLTKEKRIDELRRWLTRNNCYVFTINGFPYGQFHGTRVKERVYVPDWAEESRLDYTLRLFDIVALLANDAGLKEASVSTLPGSFKEFVTESSHEDQIFGNLLKCAVSLEQRAQDSGLDLHLGLEPEPLGLFETSSETVRFFSRLLDHGKKNGVDAETILRRLGVNYDTCHLACEFESAAHAFGRLLEAGIRISKIHLSSALKVSPTADARERLADFADDVYLHQVIQQDRDGGFRRWRDLPDALQAEGPAEDSEWRIHFHVPLHAAPAAPFETTADHLEETLQLLSEKPEICRHLEMETYTWDVLPPEMRENSVVDQLVREYDWTLPRLNRP